MRMTGHALIAIASLVTIADLAGGQELVPVAEGPSFVVSSSTYQSRFPAVSRTADGFIVVWQTYAKLDRSKGGVFVREFRRDGTPLGTEFRVTSYTTSGQGLPDVSAAGDGTYAIVWVD